MDITLKLQKSVSLGNMLDELVNMPGKEKVEEEPLTKVAFNSFLKKFGVMLRSRTSPSKRIRITLNETVMAGQRLATALN